MINKSRCKKISYKDFEKLYSFFFQMSIFLSDTITEVEISDLIQRLPEPKAELKNVKIPVREIKRVQFGIISPEEIRGRSKFNLESLSPGEDKYTGGISVVEIMFHESFESKSKQYKNNGNI